MDADHPAGRRSPTEAARAARIDGGPGDDTLTGGGGDALHGRGGDDLLLVSATFGQPQTTADGGAGDDTFRSSGPTYNFGLLLYGGGGDDSFTFDTVQASTVEGGAGRDAVDIRSVLSGAVDGGDGSDRITLGSMLGTVEGGNGDDAIAVGIGKGDQIYGGGGDDTISVGYGSSRAYGGDGDDVISGQADRYQVNTLDGGAGDDTITGAGHDVLLGGGGRDWLESAGQNDTLTGGAGADRFVYGALVNPGSIVADAITDFSVRGRDVLDLSGLMEEIGASNDPFRDGYLAFRTSGGSTSVLVDPEGGGGDYRTLAVLQGTVLTRKDKGSYAL